MSLGPLHSLALGIIQGLTEFLPISSSAHLILIPRYLGWEDPGLAYDVALHLGTLAGVVIYFWSDLWDMLLDVKAGFHPRPQSNGMAGRQGSLPLLILVATIPGAIAGVLLQHKVETVFRSPALIAIVLILMGALLAMADWLSKQDKTIADLTWGAAFGIGAAQSLALVPGVSRSGITITIALALGLNRREAAKFSFLLSIPIIAGAGILKCKAILHSPEKLALAIGFAGAAVSGIFAIWMLFKIIQTRRYTPFVVYRWVLGAFVLFNLAKFQ